MSDTNLTLSLSPSTPITPTPRIRRGELAVVAQYIQDLTHPSNAR